MRTLINYIRQCFCKHDWKLLSHQIANQKYYWCTANEVWVHECKKCGYKKTYKIHAMDR